MTNLLVALVGILFTAGVFLILRGNLFRLVLGMVMLGNAVNLLLLGAGRLTTGTPPLVPAGAPAPPTPVANPLPQALILTAIVIGFALVTFTLVLAQRGYDEFGTTDVRSIETKDLGDDTMRPSSKGHT